MTDEAISPLRRRMIEDMSPSPFSERNCSTFYGRLRTRQSVDSHCRLTLASRSLINEDTLIQLHGIGPTAIVYLNPADDPRKSSR